MRKTRIRKLELPQSLIYSYGGQMRGLIFGSFMEIHSETPQELNQESEQLWLNWRDKVLGLKIFKILKTTPMCPSQFSFQLRLSARAKPLVKVQTATSCLDQAWEESTSKDIKDSLTGIIAGFQDTLHIGLPEQSARLIELYCTVGADAYVFPRIPVSKFQEQERWMGADNLLRHREPEGSLRGNDIVLQTQTVFNTIVLGQGISRLWEIPADSEFPRLQTHKEKEEEEEEEEEEGTAVQSEIFSSAALEKCESEWILPATNERESSQHLQTSIQRIYERIGITMPKVIVCEDPTELAFTQALALLSKSKSLPAVHATHRRFSRIWEICNQEQAVLKHYSLNDGTHIALRNEFWSLLTSLHEKALKVIDPTAIRSAISFFRSGASCSLNILREMMDRVIPEAKIFKTYLRDELLITYKNCREIDWSKNEEQFNDDYEPTIAVLNKHFDSINWSDLLVNWWSLPDWCHLLPYIFLSEQYPQFKKAVEDTLFADWIVLKRNCYAAHFSKEVALVCESPIAVNLDRQFRFHSDGGPSIRFRNNQEKYHLRNVEVAPEHINSSLSVEMIDETRNIELRRLLLEKFGYERFMREGKCTLINEDEYGFLFKRELQNDEPLVMVFVSNATKEEDGTRKGYMLRVPPNTRTAKEGVAWTFGMTEDEYEPKVET